MKIIFISLFASLIFLLGSGYHSYLNFQNPTDTSSFNPADSCKDIIKKYDPFLEDSVLQTESRKMGKLSYKFLLSPKKTKILMRVQFTTFTPDIIYDGELFSFTMEDSSLIRFMVSVDSYPEVSGKDLYTHSFEFTLNDSKVLFTLKYTPIKSVSCASHDFSNLTDQNQFMQNLRCISTYVIQ